MAVVLQCILAPELPFTAFVLAQDSAVSYPGFGIHFFQVDASVYAVPDAQRALNLKVETSGARQGGIVGEGDECSASGFNLRGDDVAQGDGSGIIF